MKVELRSDAHVVHPSSTDIDDEDSPEIKATPIVRRDATECRRGGDKSLGPVGQIGRGG